MKLDAKTIYAQSSDIKCQTYLEYRKYMKKKAIAELDDERRYLHAGSPNADKR